MSALPAAWGDWHHVIYQRVDSSVRVGPEDGAVKLGKFEACRYNLDGRIFYSTKWPPRGITVEAVYVKGQSYPIADADIPR